MRKLGLLLGSILIIILGLIFYMNYNDKNYMENMKKKIIANTEIDKIEYINVYDNYYIVLSDEDLYLLDDKYNVVLDVEKFLIYENSKNYDIIYNDKHFMYLNDVYEDDQLIYEYYDIYTYKLIKRVIVGGTDGTNN